ncbi:GNAT family N-acetyltransferase [Paenibacillus sp. RRE4]|uniref:GNAT family N-acetyltransferase n=1 Tax=Paenibacillus sp. RRE4 TaxID=2962587 RepID=UPI0028822899|nr:GNAT family N-acetyltransferase [Paenibacillus sp. RRE4]MDT0121583.1 GNAT family N-acetyltransferase [Paenibacillus sp. RRE4]
MQEYQIIKMNDFSNDQINQIRMLEELCKINDNSSLRVGIESLKEIDGDHAFLCHHEDQLVGFLSWYSSDGMEANINSMVHPQSRRSGVFRELLQRATAEMQMQGIRTCRFRIPSNSESGIDCIRHLGASFNSSEFSMTFKGIEDTKLCVRDINLRLAVEQDLEFMITCLSEAFGDSESWTREYLSHTKESSRITYIAMDRLTPVGMIRVNCLHTNTAIIHDFCVLPAFQGRGYGRGILSKVVKFLQNQEYSPIRLSVVTQNRRALSLYQSIGFDVSAESLYYVIPMDNI